MKVLQVISDLSLKAGGPPVSTVSNGSALVQCGHNVEIVTTDKYGEQIDFDARIDPGLKISTFACWPPEKLAISPGLTRHLMKTIPNVDVVIIHGLYLYHTLAAATIARHFGKPYVLQPHGSLDPFLWRHHRLRKMLVEGLFQDRVTRGASAFWFTADDEQKLASSFIHGAHSFVAPHVLNLRTFLSNRDRTPFDTAFENATILFYGRVNFKKGLDILIEAFGILQQRGVRADLVVAGPIDPEMPARLAEWEQKAGVSGRVRYLGSIKGEERLDALSSATVFALPSYTENFGIAILEALGIGLPVLVSDQVNIHELISSGDVGWVTPCDATAVADALQRALTDRDLNKRLRDNSADFLERHFSIKANARILEAGLMETIRRHKEAQSQA